MTARSWACEVASRLTAMRRGVLPIEASAVLKRLRAIGQQTAERLQMAPELMLRKKNLEALLRSGYPNGPYQLPDSLRGWRRELMGADLLAALEQA